MLKPRLSLAAIAALLSIVMPGFADTVTKKTGEKIEGRILSETDTEVTIEVMITASIKDQLVIKKAEIDKIEKVQPDAEAWASLKNLALGEDSLEKSEYQRAINLLNGFVTQFPESANAAEAKKKIAAFQEEMKRVEAGEMKVAGKWLTADEVKEERVQIEGRILLSRMRRHAAAGQLVESMRIYDALEQNASGSSSFPDAVVLARQILPAIKTAADQGKLQLKARVEEGKRRLQNVTGGERAQLENLLKQQAAQAEAAINSLERAGVKWLPLQPATDKGLSNLSVKASGALISLNAHNVEKMKESLAASDVAREALAKNDIPAAEKAIVDANNAWPKNEYVTRLQPKIAEAKAKAAQPATPAPTPAPVAATTPKATPTPKPAEAPVPVAVVEEEPKKEGSILTKPAFWVILIVVVGLGALAMKALGKFKRADKNILDQ